jgi:tRNA A37 threonylcarbamoyladenosine dehydratase
MSNPDELASIYHRNRLLWGEAFQNLLSKKHIMVFGLGGVGSFAAEALARTGIGSLSVIDFDSVSPSNINRQLIATLNNINRLKTEVIKERIFLINPDIKVITHNIFYEASLNSEIFASKPDYVVDAIDSVNSKIDLIQYCRENNIPLISSSGTGNRLDPSALTIKDISETKGLSCPLTRKIRKNLEKIGITKGVTLVVSSETPVKPDYSEPDNEALDNKHPPGSTPFVPPVSGFIMASYVIRSFLDTNK